MEAKEPVVYRISWREMVKSQHKLRCTAGDQIFKRLRNNDPITYKDSDQILSSNLLNSSLMDALIPHEMKSSRKKGDIIYLSLEGEPDMICKIPVGEDGRFLWSHKYLSVCG